MHINWKNIQKQDNRNEQTVTNGKTELSPWEKIHKTKI